MKIPEPQNSIANLIYESHEKEAEHPRPHLGASLLGHPCDRWLWLTFRHAVVEKFSGRMRLLFSRGHDEEMRVVNNLRRIGMHVSDTGVSQSRYDFGKHVSGSSDGIVSGVPGAQKAKAVLEIKTHNDKSFKELCNKGVKEAKLMHWVQCHMYGYGAKLNRALYVAVNKNTDEIYTEWLHLEKGVAEKYIARAHRITMAERLPEPISSDPSWYQCKFCAAHSFCHGDHLTKHANCRTCAHVTPREDSTWHCARYDAGNIPLDHQRTGCDSHVLHPDLVPWQMLDSPNQWEAVYEIDGTPIRNGEGDAFCFTSHELIANAGACVAAIRGDDKFITDMRRAFDARVVG
jgi:hypothetical protein